MNLTKLGILSFSLIAFSASYAFAGAGVEKYVPVINVTSCHLAKDGTYYKGRSTPVVFFDGFDGSANETWTIPNNQSVTVPVLNLRGRSVMSIDNGSAADRWLMAYSSSVTYIISYDGDTSDCKNDSVLDYQCTILKSSNPCG